LRAVEEGLPLMRAANTGITAGFDAFGRELARLPANSADVLVVDLPGALPPTPYSRGGLAIPAALVLISLFPAVWGMRLRTRPPFASVQKSGPA
jgi:apolipoprotein N-acyltransferase